MRLSEKIKCSSLFGGIDELQLDSLLTCLRAVKRQYHKDEFVFVVGRKATSVGIVLSGGVRILQEDFWGRRAILAQLEPGELFGEAFSCVEKDALPISVIASEPCEILLIDYRKIVTTCSSVCDFHTRLIMNMMRILAEKNILLIRKIEHLSKRTTREKLLSFLSARAVSAGTTTVEIPFNRQELADYLCVERSAMSRELGLMQTEGLLRYDRNRFELIRPDGG
ncbi:Crp/Fnr family transcriptional regulator [Desulfosarcina sp. OttesenSCG-928-G10]|nr:Crp/Fnr family transcriptional regulator [Desulfosarcina sp. OttesenSCG-928-G10]